MPYGLHPHCTRERPLPDRISRNTGGTTTPPSATRRESITELRAYVQPACREGPSTPRLRKKPFRCQRHTGVRTIRGTPSGRRRLMACFTGRKRIVDGRIDEIPVGDGHADLPAAGKIDDPEQRQDAIDGPDIAKLGAQARRRCAHGEDVLTLHDRKVLALTDRAGNRMDAFELRGGSVDKKSAARRSVRR